MAYAQYLLGIDGGGTGCRARLTEATGRVLGHGAAGPANLGLGVDVALEAIMTATRQALAEAGLGEEQLMVTHAGLGIAAANVPTRRQALESARLPFLSVTVRSDAEIACLGAHGGHDGGILILGTGSQGIVLCNGTFSTIGGWGFALSDTGSGAILGRAAVRRSFLAHEGVESASAMTAAVMAHFDADPVAMLRWAPSARPRDWAGFARTVFEYAERGDPVALELVHASVTDVERLLDRLIEIGAARIALMGGLALPSRRYLPARFESVIVESQGDALDGALLLARRAAGLLPT